MAFCTWHLLFGAMCVHLDTLDHLYKPLITPRGHNYRQGNYPHELKIKEIYTYRTVEKLDFGSHLNRKSTLTRHLQYNRTPLHPVIFY